MEFDYFNNSVGGIEVIIVFVYLSMYLIDGNIVNYMSYFFGNVFFFRGWFLYLCGGVNYLLLVRNKCSIFILIYSVYGFIDFFKGIDLRFIR